MKGHRYKKRGWFGEPHRHYLASKGIKTKKGKSRRYFAYEPTYVAGDLPLIFGDALGTAGASVASWAWLAGPLAAGAVAVKVGKEVKKVGDDDKMFAAFKTIEDENPTDLLGIDDTSTAHKYRLYQIEMSPDEFLKNTKEAAELKTGKAMSVDEFIEGGRSESKLKRIKQGLEKEEDVVPTVVLKYDEQGRLEDFQEGRNRAIAAKEMGMEEIPVIIAQRRSRGDRQLDFEGPLPRSRFGTPIFNIMGGADE